MELSTGITWGETKRWPTTTTSVRSSSPNVMQKTAAVEVYASVAVVVDTLLPRLKNHLKLVLSSD